ncbi:MAG: hypothetical protein H8D84_02570 [Proteobacteria bacterium]|nr:hypothetical protein [Pseudomonadota bacterium]
MKKVNLVVENVVVGDIDNCRFSEGKVDGRTLNTGRPVNKKSSRQIRLAKQDFYQVVNNDFQTGKSFTIANKVYNYVKNDNVINDVNGYAAATVNYVGRTKILAYAYVLGKKVNLELNLKTLKFTK